MAKLQVYFNEYNVLMENAIYLPLVSGQLQSYALTDRLIRKNYQFMPFIFIRDYPDKILSRYKDPAVCAFSISVWNANLSLAVAREIKKRFPKCLIVFGGPHVPFNATGFFQEHPFIDVTVRGEGEKSFADLLVRFLGSRDFEGIAGVTYRDYTSGKCIRNNEERHPEKDLDIFPSPYLEGAFDYLMDTDIDLQVIIETNRGCSFSCAYCIWGQGGLSKRFAFFSLQRVKDIAFWCGARKIKYVHCADSNFGMFKRDIEIADHFTRVKSKYDFPEKFRVSYGKSAENNIYETGKLFHEHDMSKGVTLSRQSNSPEVLSNVGRKNIKLSVFRNLQKRYAREGIHTYTELILVLPGETYQSFVKGIEDIMQSGIKNQIIVYLCQVYPNTALADPEYQKRFKINTVRIPVNELHAAVRPPELIAEYEDIIVSTASMPQDDWKRSAVFSWVMQLLHELKVGFYVFAYLVDRYQVKYTDFFEYIALLKMRSDKIKILRKEVETFYEMADSILKGSGRRCIMPDFGSIYWEPEEASLLNISNNKESFYGEMYALAAEFLDSMGAECDEEELKEVIEYQKIRISDYKPLKRQKYYFKRNIPEYFDTFFLDERRALSKTPQVMVLDGGKDYNGDKKMFAKEVAVYGRKNDRILYPVKWSNQENRF